MHRGMQPQRCHPGPNGVEATWKGPGLWEVVRTGVTIRQRAGRWWIFGLHATGHGPFQTLDRALTALLPLGTTA
jgi:hypothetical protein